MIIKSFNAYSFSKFICSYLVKNQHTFSTFYNFHPILSTNRPLNESRLHIKHSLF
ncbi:DALR anticodon-binding domain-containing protein [Bacillus pumilus]|uniref:DALR anticodon-binding domain-containing protein n=1 Tax=Bacillus pumilus TaxID=1408 RepID=UPI003C29B216